MTRRGPIPVIDLFAGPGGLGEGFTSLVDDDQRSFEVKVSIEKDPVAHKTLSLRALFRAFPAGEVPACYYEYVRGEITRESLFAHPDAKSAAEKALFEARCIELGKTSHKEVDECIREALKGAREWVLIGGPPCQAYSMAGRARMRQQDTETFEKDKRHFLYREYLRIIREFGPTVFVMENVKGMLTSQHKGSPIFERIMKDLQSPGNCYHYEIRSFVVDKEELDPEDFIIRAEEYGVPQRRHRVILFGIRSDLVEKIAKLGKDPDRLMLRPVAKQVSVSQVLEGLPKLRSRLSKEPDSHENWLNALNGGPVSLKGWRAENRMRLELEMMTAVVDATKISDVGSLYTATSLKWSTELSTDLKKWLHDPKLAGVLQHETRSHMRSDIQRYLFASCFAKMSDYSPKIQTYPPKLQPAHKNATAESIPFTDRFRVQLANDPSTTVVSHIAKDGHYYIHHDPAQCRSLTVREAARLQTFPDNYFFEGNRTQQYHQIGNAVPPYLARKIAEIVREFVKEART